MNGWASLGEALGGNSEEAYQEGRALGAKTEAALAEARERVEKNAAKARMENDLIAANVPRNAARAAATAMTAGGDLTDPMQLLLKNQEYDFRAKAGDPNVPIDEGQRALLGVANGPVEQLYKVGGGYADKFDRGAGITPLGDAGGGESGGSSSFMQSARAFGLLRPDGTIDPAKYALAYEVLRNTDKVFDVGGVPQIRTGNPFGSPGQAAAPVAAPAPAPASAATPGAAPAAPLATVDQVASNKGAIAAATEQGQAIGRNAAGLESTLLSIDDFGKTIDNFLTRPGFNSLYGNIQGTEIGKTIGGVLSPDIANARADFDTLGGKAFLASIQKMRGMGQLSNQEGLKVQTALTRALDSRISEAEARIAWQEVKMHLAELKRVATIEAGQMQQQQAPADAGGWQTINGVRIRVKPQ